MPKSTCQFSSPPLLSVSISSCVQQPTEGTSESADPLLKELGPDDHIYIRNITAMLRTKGKMLGVNLTDEERTAWAVQVAATYADDYDEIYNIPEMPNMYTLAANEFHLTIGRAYNLTDDEIPPLHSRLTRNTYLRSSQSARTRWHLR